MGMYSNDELSNLHNEAQEDGLSYKDVYGETYEQSCASYSPWQAEQDARDYEANASHDYLYEAYGYEARVLADQAEWEGKQERNEWRERTMDDMEANGGPRYRIFEWYERDTSPALEALRLLTDDDIPF